MTVHHSGIRSWEPLSDLPRLVEVSHAADALFAEFGLVLPPDDPAPELLDSVEVLVAQAPHPVGFAMLRELDGHAHLAQLAVHPDFGRRGFGSQLLAGALSWADAAGYPALTLTTFTDVPWNQPWYVARGFRELPRARWGAGLRRQWAAEQAAGIQVAPRVAMIREV